MEGQLGTTANSYEVLAKLASGGMADIFLARSAGLAAVQRYVVLKRVLREYAHDVSFVQMFLDEARLAAQLQHPNIAQVYDVGRLGDSYFFTMEYVHGETVRSLINQAHHLHRSLPLGCVLGIAAGAAAGLHHAHTRIGIDGLPLGIVHRDVSPSNLMVGYDGSVKLVDFGVAKAANRMHETQAGGIKGKISYLSPEQARAVPVDARSDVFSLGIVIWELLTIDRLYKHESAFGAMAAIINEPAPPPSSRRRDCPRELDELVLKALAKRPEDRFQTAEELGEQIEKVAILTSSSLSSAGVARYVRELFGHRPEPWIELSRRTDAHEVVTVTAEPVPQAVAIPSNDPIDGRLAAVVELDVTTPSLTSGERPTTVLPVQPVTGSDFVPRRPRNRALVYGVAAVGLAIVLGLVIAAFPTPDAIIPDASVAIAAPRDAAVIPDAPAPPIDAAAAVEPPPIDATAPIADAPAPPIDAPEPPPVRRKKVGYDDCVAGRSSDWSACVLVACQQRRVQSARAWFAKVPTGKRGVLVKPCANAGVRVDQPDCQANPLDCP